MGQLLSGRKRPPVFINFTAGTPPDAAAAVGRCLNPAYPSFVQCSTNSSFLDVVTLGCSHTESHIKSYFPSGETDINNVLSNIFVLFCEAKETSRVYCFWCLYITETGL